MLTYLSTYGVLICNEHYSYALQLPTNVRVLAPYSTPFKELGLPQDALRCCYERPVKVQTFFREKRYIHYFIVKQEQRETGQTGQQQQQRRQETAEQNQEVSYQQRLAYLSCECDAIERKDREAIERIAEEADAKDRTGWFKRTQWDEHLQAYPDWQLLSYAIRLPTAEEPQLQRVVQLVEGLVEEAVQGLSTLPRDTLRWLRSAKLQEPNVRPFSRIQNKAS
ncbi:hypothetical protein GGP41_002226 [Bipolaris sorokiniana]|uniref:Uncharacterized protein n=1 Tax=Cochliobolus sativus TaxID=45130 RepID=A0A8H6DQ73_COCSA|nr:hypothetical protein GGP41_002226 [Bipolaris sorokiniana]